MTFEQREKDPPRFHRHLLAEAQSRGRISRVVAPGSSLFVNGFADKLYLYPVTQRNYIVSRRQDEGDVIGEDFITAPSSDRIPVQFQVATYFKLNTNRLQKFHE